MEYDKKRIWIAVALGIFILVLSTYVIINREKVFTSKIDITYPDGCVETYRNTILLTPLCTDGRVLQLRQLPDVAASNVSPRPELYYNTTQTIKSNIIIK